MIERMMANANRRMSARARIEADDATVVLGGQDGPVLLFVIEDTAGAANHAGERIFVHMNRKVRLLAEQQVETADERAAAGHDDASIDDIAGQLRRSDLERATYGIDNRLDRLLDGFADLAGVNSHGLRNAGHEVAPLHFHLALFPAGSGRSDLDLDLFRRRLAD